jgi:hypothetical protein
VQYASLLNADLWRNFVQVFNITAIIFDADGSTLHA